MQRYCACALGFVVTANLCFSCRSQGSVPSISSFHIPRMCTQITSREPGCVRHLQEPSPLSIHSTSSRPLGTSWTQPSLWRTLGRTDMVLCLRCNFRKCDSTFWTMHSGL
ncbi:hypothetical protein JAAARDRAFT_456978 [Jaapia argillacea MUCL 33604]|uniref:Secreted protein n=1 Tax=Jaapia argillacea MUCL 33604 TaxID=933084 RepID=A0A067Q5K2_9AGAM|nr:hypothetical protein JAAARDRAFT_456978 [Jaapia argillacea MUCL 33604]